MEAFQWMHHKTYVELFKTALERMPTNECRVVIRTDKAPTGKHPRGFNALTQTMSL